MSIRAVKPTGTMDMDGKCENNSIVSASFLHVHRSTSLYVSKILLTFLHLTLCSTSGRLCFGLGDSAHAFYAGSRKLLARASGSLFLVLSSSFRRTTSHLYSSLLPSSQQTGGSHFKNFSVQSLYSGHHSPTTPICSSVRNNSG